MGTFFGLYKIIYIYITLSPQSFSTGPAAPAVYGLGYIGFGVKG